MYNSSICIRAAKTVYHFITNSVVYRFMLAVLSYLIDAYKDSCFRKFLLKLGSSENFTETSLFYKFFNSIFGFFFLLSRKFYAYFKNSVTYKILKTSLKNSFFFSFKNSMPILIFIMFSVPHDLWNNTYALIMALAMCVLYIAEYASERDVGKNFLKIPFSLILFFASLVLGIVISYDVSDSIRTMAFFVTSYLICFCIYGSVYSYEKMQRLLFFIYCSLMVMSVLAIFQRITGIKADASLTDLKLNAHMPGRVFGTLGNPNNFAEVLTLFIPLCAAYILNLKNETAKFFATLSMALPMAALLLTYSRSGWIAFFVSVIVFIALYNYKLLPILAFGAICMIPLLPQSILNRILTIGNLSDSSSSYRVDIWTGCLEMLKKYWFTGIGIGSGAFKAVYPPYAVGTSAIAPHSHMQIMEMLIEGGILCLAAYLWFNYCFIKNSCVGEEKTKNSDMKNILIAGTAGVSGIMVIGCFEYCWFYPRVMFAFFVCMGICFAALRISKKILIYNGRFKR